MVPYNIDTHAIISSPEGYYPGLPEHVLKIIRPSNFVSVAAKPEEIYNRRMKDDTRNRDKITLANIKKELDYQTGMISACAVITGSPVRHVLNGVSKENDLKDTLEIRKDIENYCDITAEVIKEDIDVIFAEPSFGISLLPWHNLFYW